MSGGYVVTMQRNPTITDADARRRLAAAYNVILAASRKALVERAADGERLADIPSAADDARLQVDALETLGDPPGAIPNGA